MTGADAPVNDLHFVKQLLRYRAVDRDVADTALKVLRRHGWYLTQELVVFSLFSDKVDVDEKSRLAARLQTFRVPELGVPDFPDVDEGTELVDLLGPNSWTLFMLLETGTSWLQSGPETWSEDPDYQETAAFVTKVKVTNDVAERGVKLVTDYMEILTKDDTTREFLLQGVELHRRKFPDFQKKIIASAF
ncbi:hypothetical protein FJT64_004800 [Amphibalanus amphitrite]|uniref:Uncharacterized protein n=1 Tax=Amphibalanus amphitrite TaxID=1232801 RepID=A0A6A4VNM7_AMPAM|nr:hypothetical protein FJT64_004800 [Amphibalanus amphitrite]